jgi:hypothetical protein
MLSIFISDPENNSLNPEPVDLYVNPDSPGETRRGGNPSCYEISTLEAKIVERLASSSMDFFELKSDPSTLKCTILCSNDVVFNVNNSMAPLLGFNKTTRLLANIKHESEDLVNIMRINCIKVVCNLALGSFENGN